MPIPRRLIAFVITGAVVIAGATTWLTVRDRAARAEAACEERSAERDQQQSSRVMTAAERTEALRIAAADPLVQKVWGGSPPVVDGLSGPGLVVFPKLPLTDRGPLGLSVMANLNLPNALPAGAYRWRVLSETYRNGCWGDGHQSTTIQEVEGDTGAIGVGQPFARTPTVLIEVSLSKKRVVSIVPNGGDTTKWRNVGRSERLIASAR